MISASPSRMAGLGAVQGEPCGCGRAPHPGRRAGRGGGGERLRHTQLTTHGEATEEGRGSAFALLGVESRIGANDETPAFLGGHGAETVKDGFRCPNAVNARSLAFTQGNDPKVFGLGTQPPVLRFFRRLSHSSTLTQHGVTR